MRDARGLRRTRGGGVVRERNERRGARRHQDTYLPPHTPSLRNRPPGTPLDLELPPAGVDEDELPPPPPPPRLRLPSDPALLKALSLVPLDKVLSNVVDVVVGNAFLSFSLPNSLTNSLATSLTRIAGSSSANLATTGDKDETTLSLVSERDEVEEEEGCEESESKTVLVSRRRLRRTTALPEPPPPPLLLVMEPPVVREGGESRSMMRLKKAEWGARRHETAGERRRI